MILFLIIEIKIAVMVFFYRKDGKMEKNYFVKKIRHNFQIIVVGILATIIFVSIGTQTLLRDENGAESSLQSELESSKIADISVSNPSPTPFSDVNNEEFQQLSEWNLVLVNPMVPVPDSYIEECKFVQYDDVEIDSRILEPLEKMLLAARNDGMNLWISSCYRNQELQEKLYNQEIQNNLQSGMTQEDAIASAAQAVARPGYSEHNIGLAIDFNGVMDSFKETQEYKWLQDNAADYGFVLRYPEGKESYTYIMYEPWHYRYVGVEHAKKMKELGMCLEEYIRYLQQHQ